MRRPPASLLARLDENPFYVLGLQPEASRSDVEREGQKLLAMLELGLEAARCYETPLGPRQRTAERVRDALAALRDPDLRLAHELWALLPAEAILERDDDAAELDALLGDREPWPDAPSALGWKGR